MRILCVADHIDPLVYSAHIKERYEDIDLVLSAGDLPMDYLGFLASSLNKPVVFVFGNHNLKHLDRFRGRTRSVFEEPMQKGFVNFFGATHVGGKVKKIKGLLIAGLGGSKRYNNGENQFTERQMMWKIVRMLPRLWWNRVFHGRFLDVFLAHAPPYGVGDKPDPCHEGFRAFKWFLRKFRPAVMVHGHIHLYDLNARRERRYNGVPIINVYNHHLLELEETDGAFRPTGSITRL